MLNDNSFIDDPEDINKNIENAEFEDEIKHLVMLNPEMSSSSEESDHEEEIKIVEGEKPKTVFGAWKHKPELMYFEVYVNSYIGRVPLRCLTTD